MAGITAISPSYELGGAQNWLARYFGYRNNVTHDASRNRFPIGVFICGAKLHNHHHARPGSAKLSQK